jgi:hypothetical protein
VGTVEGASSGFLNINVAKINDILTMFPVSIFSRRPGLNARIDPALLATVTHQLPNNNPGAPASGKRFMRFDDAKGEPVGCAPRTLQCHSACIVRRAHPT